MDSQLPSSNTSDSGITEEVVRSVPDARGPDTSPTTSWRGYFAYIHWPSLPQRSIALRPGETANAAHLGSDSTVQGAVDVRNNNIVAGRDFFNGNFNITLAQAEQEKRRNSELIDIIHPAIDPADQRFNILSLHEPEDRVLEETCTWFNDRLEELEWIESKEARFFWLTGAPGTGKTFLAIHATEKLEELVQHTNNFVIYYFFDDSSDAHLNNAEAALKSMIWSMCKQKTDLLKYVKSAHQEKGGPEGFESAGFELLLRIFMQFLQDPTVGTVYCVIDALDKCESSSQEKLLNALTSLRAHPATKLDGTTPINFKALVTSLPDDTAVRWHLSKFERLCLDTDLQKFTRRDIATWIDHKVATLRERHGWTHEFAKDVRMKLHNHHDDTYLWISFVIMELRKRGESEEVEQVLQEAPQDLLAYYERMYARIKALKKDKPQRARRIMRTVLSAFRPLTLLELYCLLGKQYQHSSKEQLKQDLYRIIRDECGNFLITGKTMRGDERVTTVNLFHPATVRRFLTSKFEDIKATNPDGKGAGHDTLSEACYAYLRLWSEKHVELCRQTNCIELTARALDPERRFGAKRTPLHGVDMEEMPLLDYAVRFWADHLQRSPRPSPGSQAFEDLQAWVKSYAKKSYRYEQLLSNTQVIPRCLALWGAFRSQLRAKSEKSGDSYSVDAFFQCWFRGYWTIALPHWRRPLRLNPLHFAAFFNIPWLLDVITQEIEHGTFGRKYLVDSDTGCRMTALHWAARNGHENFIRKMFEVFDTRQPMSVEDNGCSTTPLNWAVRNGHHSISKLLIDRGASVNRRSIGETPLLRAVNAGDLKHVELLLASHADTESRRASPAAVNFTSAILQGGYNYYLWSRPVLANAEHNRLAELTAVVSAAHSTNQIHLLAATFVTLWVASTLSMCIMPIPLVCQVTSLSGVLGIRLLWILVGITLSTSAAQGLLYAAEYMEHLRAQTGTGHTPLLLAVQRNHYEIVKILVKHKAYKEARDWMGRTPLLLALHNRAERIARFLISEGANLKAKDRNGCTASELLQELEAADAQQEHLSGLDEVAEPVPSISKRPRDKPLPPLPDDESERTSSDVM